MPVAIFDSSPLHQESDQSPFPDFDTNWCPVCDRLIPPARITTSILLPPSSSSSSALDEDASPTSPYPASDATAVDADAAPPGVAPAAPPKPRPQFKRAATATKKQPPPRLTTTGAKLRRVPTSGTGLPITPTSPTSPTVTGPPILRSRTQISQSPISLYCSERCRQQDRRQSLTFHLPDVGPSPPQKTAEETEDIQRADPTYDPLLPFLFPRSLRTWMQDPARQQWASAKAVTVATKSDVRDRHSYHGVGGWKGGLTPPAEFFHPSTSITEPLSEKARKDSKSSADLKDDPILDFDPTNPDSVNGSYFASVRALASAQQQRRVRSSTATNLARSRSSLHQLDEEGARVKHSNAGVPLALPKQLNVPETRTHYPPPAPYLQPKSKLPSLGLISASLPTTAVISAEDMYVAGYPLAWGSAGADRRHSQDMRDLEKRREGSSISFDLERERGRRKSEIKSRKSSRGEVDLTEPILEKPKQKSNSPASRSASTSSSSSSRSTTPPTTVSSSRFSTSKNVDPSTKPLPFKGVEDPKTPGLYTVGGLPISIPIKFIDGHPNSPGNSVFAKSIRSKSARSLHSKSMSGEILTGVAEEDEDDDKERRVGAKIIPDALPPRTGEDEREKRMEWLLENYVPTYPLGQMDTLKPGEKRKRLFHFAGAAAARARLYY